MVFTNLGIGKDWIVCKTRFQFLLR